jgi:hypothetical protein
MDTSIIIYQIPERMIIDQAIGAWLNEKRADSVHAANSYEDTHLMAPGS